MRVAARGDVRLPYVLGLVAFAAVVAVPPQRRTEPPQERPADPPPGSPDRMLEVVSEVEDAWRYPEPERLVTGYDAIAVELLNGPAVSDRELEARLQALPGIAAGVEVRTLRKGERMILWKAPPPAIHGGGARVSVFIREAGTWRQAGHVDSQMWTSSVWLGGVDAEHGIALLVESYDGNGWPPSRVMALAVCGGTLVSVAVDDVPTVEISDEAGPRPTVRLWRRVHDLNRYPDPPMRGSRWQVRRVRGGLAATEAPITPWRDALAAFCTDPRGGNAAPLVRNVVGRCDSEVALRWAKGGRLVATLDVVLRCGEEPVHVQDSELMLESRRGQWRVTAAPRCPR